MLFVQAGIKLSLPCNLITLFLFAFMALHDGYVAIP